MTFIEAMATVTAKALPTREEWLATLAPNEQAAFIDAMRASAADSVHLHSVAQEYGYPYKQSAFNAWRRELQS